MNGDWNVSFELVNWTIVLVDYGESSNKEVNNYLRMCPSICAGSLSIFVVTGGIKEALGWIGMASLAQFPVWVLHMFLFLHSPSNIESFGTSGPYRQYRSVFTNLWSSLMWIALKFSNYMSFLISTLIPCENYISINMVIILLSFTDYLSQQINLLQILNENTTANSPIYKP